VLECFRLLVSVAMVFFSVVNGYSIAYGDEYVCRWIVLICDRTDGTKWRGEHSLGAYILYVYLPAQPHGLVQIVDLFMNWVNVSDAIAAPCVNKPANVLVCFHCHACLQY
jgi:hypothetical protein